MFYYQMYGLQPADRVIVPIFQTGLSKHHAIYLGMDHSGVEWLIENHKFTNVRLIKASDFFKEGKKYTLQKFAGNRLDRETAVKRALGELGKSYDLINYNCEHFSELVQYGVKRSRQVENVESIFGAAAFGALLFILIAAFTNEN